MADLLSEQDRVDIRAAIGDVVDTFFKHSITLNLRTSRKLTASNSKRDDNSVTASYALRCLMVPDKNDEDAENKVTRDGYRDISQGVIYLKYTDLENNVPTLIDGAGNPIITANRDDLVFQNKTYVIFGINLVAPDEESFTLVKLQIKKQLETNG